MRITTVAAMLVVLVSGTAAAQESAKTAPRTPPPLHWGPAPAVFPAGAQMAVLAGNPGGTGEFTVRLKMPNGYKIAPHTHPTDEHVTVISGTFKVGMGRTFETDGLLVLRPGEFISAMAGTAHFAMAVGPTIVQVSAIGPFSLTYLNPADMPKAGAGN